jgi:amino acid adenylation domain-containing protein
VSPLPPPRFQFVDYAAWEHTRTAQGDLQPHIDYWKAQLANLPAPLQVPADRLRPNTPSLKGGQIAFQMPPSLSSGLTDFARDESSTHFMALLAGWQMLLHRYTQQNDIIVGTPTGRRYLADSEGMIGLFINNMVLRADFSSAPTFRELLAQVRKTTIDAFTHDELPFEDLVAALRLERTAGVSPLFQHLFIHRNATHSRWELPGLKVTPYAMHVGGSKFDLTLSMLEEGPHLSGTLEYSHDLFERDSVERIAGHYVALLGSAIENPDLPIAQLDLLTLEERNELLHKWNPPATSYPNARPHELFECRVAESPDAVAVLGDHYSLTYSELNNRANRLAARLRSLGVGPDQLVAVCLDRSPELVVALLAVLKSGGAYVPLDPMFPPDRLAYMVDNSQARVCISQQSVIDRLPGLQAELILMDRKDTGALRADESGNLPVVGGFDDLAYVIYTSGSTGKPKGVQVTQRGLANFLHSMQKEPGITRDDVLHSLTTVCFDIAGLELFLPLIAGARVVVMPQKLALDPLRLLASIQATGTTIMQATPVTWRMLLDHGWRGSPKLKVLIGGEAMSPELAEQLIATGCEVWNMYGPTETTIWSSVRRVKSKSDAVNLGAPIANTEFLICSPQMTLQPVGIPGELLIGGDGLARGYFRLDETTREKFIVHPFEAGKRLYRTGDLAVRSAGGAIHFLGRIDNQVKIRGFRIELGEIETRLDEHPAVKQTVVIAREDTPGDKRLVAYLVLEPGASTDAFALREHARGRLPEYMIPSAFVILSSFPLTPNGKVDRKQLPAPVEPTAEEAPGAEPLARAALGDDIADQVRAILESALRTRLPSLSANFFDLGGHSMAAITAVRAINQRFGLDLPATTLFEMPTAERLVGAISAARGGTHIKDSPGARKLTAEENEQVDGVLEAVRTATSSAPQNFRGMRESLICKYLLAPLYGMTGRSLRELIKRAILKLEGGSAFTVTLRRLFKKKHDIDIGNFTSCAFDADRLRRTTKIGKFCSIYRTALFQNADHPRNTLGTHGIFYHSRFGFSSGYELDRVQIEVGNDVWIGDGAKVLYPTRKIGHGAIVAAGAVVIEDVPPYAIVAGYPAQIVRYRFSQETIAKLLELRWWDRPVEELHAVREAFLKPLEGKRIR